jgi:hypothetical protein
MLRTLWFSLPILIWLGCHNLIVTPNVIQAPDAGAGDIFYHAVLDCEKPAANISDHVTPCLDKATKTNTNPRPCSDIAATNACLAGLYPNHTINEIGCKVIELNMTFHVAMTKQTATTNVIDESLASDLWIVCEQLGMK